MAKEKSQELKRENQKNNEHKNISSKKIDLKGKMTENNNFKGGSSINDNIKNSNIKNNTTKKRNLKKKNLIIAILVILVIVVVVTIIHKNKKSSNEKIAENQIGQESNAVDYVEEIEPGVKINKSAKLNEAKTVDGLTFTNIQLTTKSGMSTLLVDVVNNTGTKTELKQVKVTLYDKNYNEIVTLSGIVAALDPGAITELNIATTSDYINAYDLKIEIE